MPRGEQNRLYIGSLSDVDTTGHRAATSLFYETLIREGRVTIPNVGSFRVKHKKPFRAHNNIVGTVIEVGGHDSVAFTPSPKLKELVRSGKKE